MAMDDQETTDGYRMAAHEILTSMIRQYDLYTLTTRDTRQPLNDCIIIPTNTVVTTSDDLYDYAYASLRPFWRIKPTHP